MERKRETTSEDLCKNYPHEFFEYVDYTRNLEYEENPDYDFLRQKFKDVLKGLNEEMDYIYDWTTSTDLKKRANKKKQEVSVYDSEDNKNKDEKELESNHHEQEAAPVYQLDRNETRQIKRNDSHEFSKDRGEDKVESVCCTM